MSMGRLDAVAALDRPDLLAPSVAKALANDDGTLPAAEVGVAEIDPDLADTAAFCEQYGVSLDVSANCVVVTGKRDGEARFAACVIRAVEDSGMEYGGITPVGLPADWPVYVDAAVAAADRVVIGSGVRRSKLTVPGALLTRLPGAAVIEGLGR